MFKHAGFIPGLNTSYVSVKQILNKREELEISGLNTSYVSVKLPFPSVPKNKKARLNTSYVSVKLKGGSMGNASDIMSQYIICIG